MDVNTHGLEPFKTAFEKTPYLQDSETKLHRKLCNSLDEAIRRSGLKDGMTISFHHAFREGDKVLMLVVSRLAELGFKDLTIASSSLLNCHDGIEAFIRQGVVSRIYTSGLRGTLGEAISRGLLDEPVQVHSHGGRVHLLQTGELKIDVAFLGVVCCDEFGNASGTHGDLVCGSLGYAKVDADFAAYVVAVTQTLAPFPYHPASISQDRVDAVVKVDEVGDSSLISEGAARMTKNPRDLLIAQLAAEVIQGSGYFVNGFSLQTGSGGAATATTIYLGEMMEAKGIKASFALGGITGTMVDLQKRGLIDTLIDVQSFDKDAGLSLQDGAHHVEISANEYANPSSKAAYVDRVDVVLLSALEVDTDFNVNVITGSDGILRGASGGHCDVAAGANLTIVVTPLVRSRIPCVVEKVITRVTPGSSVDILVTDHGLAVNPARPEIAKRLTDAGLTVMSIEELHRQAIAITGQPRAIEFTDKVVGVIRYRDGTVIDQVRQVKRAG